MTRTREMREAPDPREVNRVLAQLELEPRQPDYTGEMRTRAVAILQEQVFEERRKKWDAQVETDHLREVNQCLAGVLVAVVLGFVVIVLTKWI